MQNAIPKNIIIRINFITSLFFLQMKKELCNTWNLYVLYNLKLLKMLINFIRRQYVYLFKVLSYFVYIIKPPIWNVYVTESSVIKLWKGLNYSWASLSCCTSLNLRGLFIDPPRTFPRRPCCANLFLMNREMRTWGRFCHSIITSFGAITWDHKLVMN